MRSSIKKKVISINNDLLPSINYKLKSMSGVDPVQTIGGTPEITVFDLENAPLTIKHDFHQHVHTLK